MRISELLSENATAIARKPLMSSRFEHDFEAEKNYPGFLANFVKFLKHYETAPVTQPYNAKDGNLSVVSVAYHLSPPLRRCHIKRGKIIVFYQLSPAEIRLIAVGPHDLEEKNNLDRLCEYARGLGTDDFEPYVPPSTTLKKQSIGELSSEQIEELRQMVRLLWSDTEEGVPILQGVLRRGADGLAEFMLWARGTINVPMDDTSHDQMIIQAFGGKTGLTSIIQQVLAIPRQ